MIWEDGFCNDGSKKRNDPVIQYNKMAYLSKTLATHRLGLKGFPFSQPEKSNHRLSFQLLLNKMAPMFNEDTA